MVVVEDEGMLYPFPTGRVRDPGNGGLPT